MILILYLREMHRIAKLKSKLLSRTPKHPSDRQPTTTMTSDTLRKSKSSRTATKELLAVAGLTAAEFSTSYAVQEYLCKTIQNAAGTAQSEGAHDSTHALHKLRKEDQMSSTETSVSKEQTTQGVPENQQPDQAAELQKLRIAAFMYQRVADSQARQKIDTSKLGQRHEALGSHPPSGHDACGSRPDNLASTKSLELN